ncbi:MAG: hypothetical protein MUF87_09885 [Anaerolineae bacterium]|jgi:hypothetical protein|nr:hypothetical protein [Anaerolineae bacterium]
MACVVVQLTDQLTTLANVHLAAALASSTQNELIFLDLRRVLNPHLLGATMGHEHLEDETYDQWETYQQIAQTYGLNPKLQVMYYECYFEALLQASEALQAVALFAVIPAGRFGLWHDFRVWRLERQLKANGCRLSTDYREAALVNWLPNPIPAPLSGNSTI